MTVSIIIPTIEAMLADKESQVLKGNLTSFVAAKNLLDTYFAGLKKLVGCTSRHLPPYYLFLGTDYTDLLYSFPCNPCLKEIINYILTVSRFLHLFPFLLKVFA